MALGNIYNMGIYFIILTFIGENEIALVLREVHEGAYNSHIGGRALAHKLLRVGYYWPTLMKDNTYFIRKCEKCHRNSNTLVETLHYVTSSWPFYQ